MMDDLQKQTIFIFMRKWCTPSQVIKLRLYNDLEQIRAMTLTSAVCTDLESAVIQYNRNSEDRSVCVQGQFCGEMEEVLLWSEVQRENCS